MEPIDFQLSDLVLAPYRTLLPSVTAEALLIFLRKNEHLKNFIRQKAKSSAFFAQPVSLIISMLIEQEDGSISDDWPLDPEMLTPIFSQLGLAES